jgi:hypothetical protein
MQTHGHNFRWLSSNPTPIPRSLASYRLPAKFFRHDRLISLYAHLPNALRNRFFPRFYRESEDFLRSLSAIEGKTHYFDGCKSLVRAELLRTSIPGTKAVHLIKNPKAYLHSFLSREKKGYRAIIEGWVRYHEASKALGDRLGGDRYLIVTFEEFVNEPQQTLQRIYRFLGVGERDGSLDEWVDLNTVHVIGSRSKNVFKQIVAKKPKWKNELTSKQIRYVDRVVEQIEWLTPILPRLDWT